MTDVEREDEMPTLAKIEEVVKSIDPDAESWTPSGDEGFKVAVVLLASAFVGPDLLVVCAFTGYHAEWLAQIAERLVANGIWKDGQVYGDYFDEQNGSFALLMHVNVGLGYFEMANDDDDAVLRPTSPDGETAEPRERDA